jgi:protein gp37
MCKVGSESRIEWCDHTFNPWEGCQKVSPGCDHCYAEARNARFGGGAAVNWGPGAPRRRTSAANWRKPIAWNASHAEFLAAHGRRQRVFCSSLADVFDNAVDPAWRADLFEVIERTPNLDWLLLTKRIGNVDAMMIETGKRLFWLDHIGDCWLPSNVWLGATIVNQEEADRDVPKLITVPVTKHFLSMEPLLGPVDLSAEWLAHRMGGKYPFPTLPDEFRTRMIHLIDWVIVGGESGPNARPMHPDWARDLRDQCADARVPFLFKQWGEWAPGENCGGPMKRSERVADWWDDEWEFSTLTPRSAVDMHIDDEPTVYRCGRKISGRVLDGVTHDGFPDSTL